MLRLVSDIFPMLILYVLDKLLGS